MMSLEPDTSPDTTRRRNLRLQKKFKAYNKKYEPELNKDNLFMGSQSWKKIVRNFCLNPEAETLISAEFAHALGKSHHMEGHSTLNFQEFERGLHNLYDEIKKCPRAKGEKMPEYKKMIDRVIKIPINLGKVAKFINKTKKCITKKKDDLITDEVSKEIIESVESACLIVASVAKTVPQSAIPVLASVAAVFEEIYKMFKAYKKIGNALRNFGEWLRCVGNAMSVLAEDNLFELEGINHLMENLDAILKQAVTALNKIGQRENNSRKGLLAKGDLEVMDAEVKKIEEWLSLLLVWLAIVDRNLTKEEFKEVKEAITSLLGAVEKNGIKLDLVLEQMNVLREHLHSGNTTAEVAKMKKNMEEKMAKMMQLFDNQITKSEALLHVIYQLIGEVRNIVTFITGLQERSPHPPLDLQLHQVMNITLPAKNEEDLSHMISRADSSYQAEGLADGGTATAPPESLPIDPLRKEASPNNVADQACQDQILDNGGIGAQNETGDDSETASTEGEASGNVAVGADQSQIPNNGGGGGSVTQSVETSETGDVLGTGTADENDMAMPTEGAVGPSTSNEVVTPDATVPGEYDYDIVLCDPLDNPEIYPEVKKFHEELESMEIEKEIKIRVKRFYEIGKDDVEAVIEAHKKCRFCFILLSDKPILERTPENYIVTKSINYAIREKEKYWNVVPVFMVKNYVVPFALKGICGIRYFEKNSYWKESVQDLLAKPKK